MLDLKRNDFLISGLSTPFTTGQLTFKQKLSSEQNLGHKFEWYICRIFLQNGESCLSLSYQHSMNKLRGGFVTLKKSCESAFLKIPANQRSARAKSLLVMIMVC